MPSSLPEEPKKSILDEIFGTPIKKGLVDCIRLHEYDTKLEEFYLVGFRESDRQNYFKTHKQGQIKYHIIKDAVLACEPCNDSNRFYNNKIEGLNKVIKGGRSARMT